MARYALPKKAKKLRATHARPKRLAREAEARSPAFEDLGRGALDLMFTEILISSGLNIKVNAEKRFQMSKIPYMCKSCGKDNTCDTESNEVEICRSPGTQMVIIERCKHCGRANRVIVPSSEG
jgi:hypothetical protein